MANENHLRLFERARNWTSRLAPSVITELEDYSEEHPVPIGRAQKRNRLLATLSNTYGRRPGEPTTLRLEDGNGDVFIGRARSRNRLLATPSNTYGCRPGEPTTLRLEDENEERVFIGRARTRNSFLATSSNTHGRQPGELTTLRLEDENEERVFIGRARTRKSLLATPSNTYGRQPGEPTNLRVEDDNEQDVFIGRARTRKRFLATPSTTYGRRLGEPRRHVPVYHSAAIRIAKDAEKGRDDVQLGHVDATKPESSSPGRSCSTVRVHHSDADSVIRPSESACEIEEGLSAMGITPPMLTSQKVDSWVVIVPRQLQHYVTLFVSFLRTAAYEMKLCLSTPAYQELPDSCIASYVEGITKAMLTCNPRLVLAVVPNSRPDLHSAIKKLCCVDFPVPSQLILHKSLISGNDRPIATEVAIEINRKVRGAPWTVDIPVQDLMVVGFDVYHDPLRQLRSVGGLVASLNKDMSRYFSAVSYHSIGEELSNDMSFSVCRALEKYKEHNQGRLPQVILVYRAGIENEQISCVYEHEVATLKRQLAQVYGESECKIAFIIVSKRINTRLFLNQSNPTPGTVVDDVITLPERYDFLLVSQLLRESTVTPSSYSVISDSSGLSPEMMQGITYTLTRLYYNWSGTFRVPAPCQCAYRLAYLVGQHIRMDPSTNLDKLPYFL